MKKFTGVFFLIIFFLVLEMNNSFSQVSVNTTGAPPNPAAMLDVQSTNKGFLLPCIDFNDRPLNPVPGLMIFVIANGPYGNNALYIYNGVSWSVLAFANLTIGSYTGGGVVFYIDPTGLHGLISSTVDQTSYADWGCFGTLIGPGAEHSEIGSGDTNTAAIAAGCSEAGIAAKICDTLTLNGFTDWYLPAIDELDSMYVHSDIIGGFNTGWYWSSTEHDNNGAFIYWPYAYPTNNWWTDKSFQYVSVRCIRKF